MLQQFIPFQFYQRLTGKEIEVIQQDLVHETAKSEKRKILCKFCKNLITSMDDKIAIAGQHEHTFTNPNGLAFEIGCFATARVTHVGISTLEYTWFKGFMWCVTLCPICYTHLGWFYQSATQKSFYGLILNCLEEVMSD